MNSDYEDYETDFEEEQPARKSKPKKFKNKLGNERDWLKDYRRQQRIDKQKKQFAD